MERRLEKAGERDVGRLRLVAAVLSIVGAAWLLFLTSMAWWSIVVAVLVVVAARFWVVRWARTEKDPMPALVLGDSALSLGERTIPWTDIERIELDHDRMVVRVVTNAEPLELDPPYGGLGLEELGRAVETARRQP